MITFEKFWEEVHVPDNNKWQGESHGSIQWKGTNVCIDIKCSCGAYAHVDTDFFYAYQCAECGKKYAVSGNVRLIELSTEQATYFNNFTIGKGEDIW